MPPSPPAHDTAPAIISDHPFRPRGKWWTLCRHCGLAEAAHARTSNNRTSNNRNIKDGYTYYELDGPEGEPLGTLRLAPIHPPIGPRHGAPFNAA